MDVTLAYPEGYDMPDWAIKQAEEKRQSKRRKS